MSPDETQTPPATPPAADPPQAPSAPFNRSEQAVPYDRFERMTKERDTAREALAQTLEAKAVSDARVKVLEPDAKRAAEYKAKVESLEAKLGNTRAVVGFGVVESELIDAIEGHYASLTGEGKPASIADMLKLWKEGNEGQPALDAVPLLLRPHLAAKWAQPAAEPAAAPKAAPAGHRAPGTSGPQGSTALSADQVYALAADVRAGKITMADYQKALSASRRTA